MISLFGITITSTKTYNAYKRLLNVTYSLHQTINYVDVPMPEKVQQLIKEQDAAVSDAISRVPAADVEV